MWLNIQGEWFPRSSLEKRIQRLSQEFQEHFNVYKDRYKSPSLKGAYWGIWIDGNPLLTSEGKQIVFKRKRDCERYLECLTFDGLGGRKTTKAYKEAILEMLERGTIVYEKRDVKDFNFPLEDR
jgi:hypothetical protein